MFGFHKHNYSILIDVGLYRRRYSNTWNGTSTEGAEITLITERCQCGKLHQIEIDGNISREAIEDSYKFLV